MSKQLDVFLAAYSREAREIALSLRKLILDVFSRADERIDPKTGMITYSVRINGREDWICAIALHMKYVDLLFSKGSQIPDHTKLLSGTGLHVRRLKITSEAETENPELHQLLKEAVAAGSVN